MILAGGKPVRIALCAILAACLAGCGPSAASRAEELAASETRMWRAYYKHDALALGLELRSSLRVQFGIGEREAGEIAKPMAFAAMKFATLRGDYDAQVLPDLENAYALLRKATGADFDSVAASRAELDWWAARRTPGKDSPEQVGALIAKLYATLYGSEKPDFQRAGVLRAQAAQLRDTGGASADWDRVEQILRESYIVLLGAT